MIPELVARSVALSKKGAQLLCEALEGEGDDLLPATTLIGRIQKLDGGRSKNAASILVTKGFQRGLLLRQGRVGAYTYKLNAVSEFATGEHRPRQPAAQSLPKSRIEIGSWVWGGEQVGPSGFASILGVGPLNAPPGA